MAGVTGISLSISKLINWCGYHGLTDAVKVNINHNGRSELYRPSLPAMRVLY